MRTPATIVAAALGALVATLSLVSPNPDPFARVFDGGPQWHVLFTSTPATATAGAIAAALVIAVLHRRVDGLACATVGLVTIGLIAITGAVPLGAQYVLCVAAGFVLGGLAISVSDDDRVGPVSLATGAAAGLLLAPHLSEARRGFPEQVSSASFSRLGVSAHGHPTDWVVLGAVLLAIAAGVVAAVSSRGEPPTSIRVRNRASLIVGVAVPVVSLILYWWLRQTVSYGAGIGLKSWALGYLALAGALVGALFLGRPGLVWVGVVAVIAANAASIVSDGGVIIALVIVVAIGIGAALGRWRPAPLAGLAALIVAVLLQLADGDLGEQFALGGAVLLLPLASAYTMSSLIPARPESAPSRLAGVPAIASIASMSAVVGIDYGWVAYTPLTDGVDDDIGNFLTGTTTASTVTMSVISLIACAAVAFVTTRRSRTTPNSTG